MSSSTSSDIVVQAKHLGKAYQLYARRNDWLKQVMLGWPMNLIIYANALTGFVEVMRDITLVGKLPDWPVYAWTLFTSFFSFYFGYWFFDRYRNVIVDVL